MSLEQALAENTAALKQFNDLMRRFYADQAHINAVTIRETEPAQATVATNGASSKPDTSSSSPAAAAAQKPAPAAAPSPAPVAAGVPRDYKKDVAPTMAKLLAAKGAPAVVALLATFGAKKGAELKPEQFDDVLTAANQALAS